MSDNDFYSQYQHPLWQRKRLEVMSLHGYSCEQCGSTDTTLHVHHRHYRKGHKVWEYETNELKCICSDCHKFEHEIYDRIRYVMSYMDDEEKIKVLGYCEAISINIKFSEKIINKESDKSIAYCTGIKNSEFFEGFDEHDIADALSGSGCFIQCAADLFRELHEVGK